MVKYSLLLGMLKMEVVILSPFVSLVYYVLIITHLSKFGVIICCLPVVYRDDNNIVPILVRALLENYQIIIAKYRLYLHIRNRPVRSNKLHLCRSSIVYIPRRTALNLLSLKQWKECYF